MKLEEMPRAGSCLIDKETYIYEELTRQRSLGFVQDIDEEVTRCVYRAFSALNFLSLMMKSSSTSLCREGTFHMGDLSPAFRGTKEGQSVLAMAVPQVSLIHDNQSAKVAHFRVDILCPLTSLIPMDIFYINPNINITTTKMNNISLRASFLKLH